MAGMLQIVQIIGIVDDALCVKFVIAHFHLALIYIFVSVIC